MKKNITISSVLLTLILFGVITVPGVMAANTTIGDSSFPVEVIMFSRGKLLKQIKLTHMDLIGRSVIK